MHVAVLLAQRFKELAAEIFQTVVVPLLNLRAVVTVELFDDEMF
jgi:hypothetical protein